MKKNVAVPLLAALLCTTPALTHAFPLDYKTGTEISKEQMDSLQIGKTTKQQVIEAFGAPNRREQMADSQIWYYDYNKIASFGKNVSESTVLEFDKAGLLISKAKSAGSGKTGNALIDAANGN